MLDAEPGQARVELRQHRPARGVDDELAGPSRHAGLGQDDDVVAVHMLAQKLTDELLGRTAAVHRGRVQEGAAGVEERAQLVPRLVLVCVAAPGHRAEPEAADPQAGPPDVALLHDRTTYRPPHGAPE